MTYQYRIQEVKIGDNDPIFYVEYKNLGFLGRFENWHKFDSIFGNPIKYKSKALAELAIKEQKEQDNPIITIHEVK